MTFNKQVIVVMILTLILAIALASSGIFDDIETGTLTFLYIVVGAGLIGGLLGLSYRYILKSKRPEVLRRQKIEEKDERNIIIRDRAGYKTLLYVFSMLIIAVIIYNWFDIEYDIAQAIPFIIFVSWIIFFTHYYYYGKRL